MSDPLIFINVRDRLTCLKQLVEWLERAGHERIVLFDNASTYGPLLDYLDRTPHCVVRLGVNLGARSLWEARPAPREPFVFTDPDIVPIDDCPLDAVAHFQELLERHPSYTKAGFGLYLDDVPSHMPYLGHERLLMRDEIEPGVFDSAIDTTFALYRPGAYFDTRAIRTGAPYLARHASPSWYCTQMTDEDWYYVTHAKKDSTGSTWARKVGS